MTSPSGFTPVMLLGLLICGSVFLLTGALLVVAIVPRARRTVLDGLRVVIDAAVKITKFLSLSKRPPGAG